MTNPFSTQTIRQPRSSDAWEQLRHDHRVHSGQQLHTVRFISGPLFTLKDSVDESFFLADGRLVRSNRLARLEAVLLISNSAVTARKLVQQAGLIDTQEVNQLIDLLNQNYDRTDSAFRVEQTATGFLLMTRPALVSWLDRLHQRQSQMKLSQPMMETLTIVAYQQPVTRANVESIRGVQSAEMIRQLIDRGLLQVGGEEDSLGRPFLYITSRQFLDMFGLGRVEDLPDYETIARRPEMDVEAEREADETESEDEETEEESDGNRTGQADFGNTG
ncbi:MAG TPA: SMC-Scp complex subunit ScpB [Planctomycetes bacterium]|nr:SMC-Scp complex subunit ScpB [Fuerstiella sp.]HIK92763.1 SMC-Scp complex subunit ScpB [Planctomycetota bacterium]